MTAIAELNIKLGVDNQASQALADVTDKLNKTAAAADKQVKAFGQNDEVIRRTTKSAQTFANANDGLTIATNRAATALANVEKAQTAFALASAKGNSAASAEASTLANLQSKAAAAQVTLDAVNNAVLSGAAPHDVLALALGRSTKAFDVFGAQSKQAALLLQQNQAIISGYATGLENLRSKYDPLFAASKNYENALKQLEIDQRVLGLSSTQLAAAQQRITDTFSAANQPIQKQISALDAFRSKIDSVFASSKKYEAQLNELNTLSKEQGLSQSQHTLLLDKLNTSFASTSEATNKFAGSTKAASFAARDLGIQSIDVFSQLSSGAPIMTTLIQQGSQVAQVWAAFGAKLKDVASIVGSSLLVAFRAIISPIGLMITGLVALGGTVLATIVHSSNLASESRALGVALAGVGKSAEVSTNQLQGYITALSHAGVSRDEAAKIVTDLARNPLLTQSQTQQVVNLVPNVAAGTGKSAVDVAKELSDALTGNYTAIKKLDDQYNFLSQNQRSAIRDGHDLEIGIDALNARFNGLADQGLSNFGKLWKALKIGADESLSFIENKAGSVGRAISSATQQAGQFDVPGVATTATTESPIPGAAAVVSSGKPVDAAAEASKKKVEDLTEAYRNQQTVLRAGVTQREVVRAGLEADIKLRDESLSQVDKEIIKHQAVAAAAAQAADAGVQETAAQRRAVDAGILLASTMDQGRAATITATAATEAHEKATTTAGISELKYAESILNRKAAEEASSGAKQVQDLQEQLSVINRIADAEALSSRAGHFTALSADIDKATHELEAYREAATDPRVVEQLTLVISGWRKVAFQIDEATAREANNKAISVSQDQLAILATQGELIGANAVQTAKQVAEQTELLKLMREQGADPAKLKAEQQTRIELTGTIVEQTAALQQQKDSANAIFDALGNAASRVGDSLVNAFVQGGGAAVNFGNIAKGILASLISDAVTLLLINPFRNWMTGGQLPTLLSGIGAIAGGGSSGGGFGSVLNTGGTLIGGANQAASLAGFDATGSLGITGPNGLLSGASSFLVGTPGLSAADAAAESAILASADFGFGGIPAAGLESTSGIIGSGGALAPALAAGGVIAGGAAAGFGLGSLAGGSIASSLNKEPGPNPSIGAGVGVGIGAAIGTIIFPIIGTAIGALIGGIIGGAGGGLIGPHVASPFSSIGLSTGKDGTLTVGEIHAQKVDTKALEDNTRANVGWLNAALTANNIQLSDLGGVAQLGQNTPNGFQDPNKAASFDAAFPGFRFSSPDQGTNSVLKDRSFTGVQQLSDITVAVRTFEETLASTDAASRIQDFLDKLAGIANADIPKRLTDIATFVTVTVPTLLGENTVQIGTLAAAYDQINQTFAPAITMAHDLSYKEAELTAARQKALAAAADLVAKQEAANNVGLNNRYLTALSTVSGDTSYAQQAQLNAFDSQAQQQRDELSQHLINTYINTSVGFGAEQVKATEGYMGVMALLEKTLGEERLAIIKQSNTQILQAANDNQAKATQSIIDAEKAWSVRELNARAQLDPSLSQAAALYSFDINAQQQRDQFTQQVVDAFGEAYKSTSYYADQMARLEDALGKERLAIQQQYNDRLTSTATATITSLSDYARSLQQGGNSPLSPLGQYDLAKNQFNAVSTAAAQGDFNSIQKLQSYSDAFLSASKGVFGSGEGYASDFNRVITALQNVAVIAPSTLTQAVYISEVRTQTQQLTSGQQEATNLLKSILLALQQNGNRPARAA